MSGDFWEILAKVGIADLVALVATGKLKRCEVIGTPEGLWCVQINKDFMLGTVRGKVRQFAKLETALETLHEAGVKSFSVNSEDWVRVKSPKKKARE